MILTELSHKITREKTKLKLILIDSWQEIVLDCSRVALPRRFVLLSVFPVDENRSIDEIDDDEQDANECGAVAADSEWNEKNQVKENFSEEIRLADLRPPTRDYEAVIL